MKRELREGLMAVTVAVVGFVVPVSIGAAWREPVTPERAHAPLPIDGPLPADGVLRFSSVDDYSRGEWPDECVQWEIRPDDRSEVDLRRKLIDRFDYVVDSPSETPCAERMPYRERGRCEHEWTSGLRLPDGSRLPFSVRMVARYYDLEESDRERCEVRDGARWIELNDE